MKFLKNLCLVMLILLCACGPQKSENSHRTKHSIHFAVAQMPLNLDPRYATDAASERVNRLLYESLIDFDDHAKPIGKLASWRQLSPVQYLFTLQKPYSKFDDGALLTAEDVKATYDSLASLKDSPLSAEFANIAAITVKAPDQVLFTLKQPDAYFVSKLILGILPKQKIAHGHDFSRKPAGSGSMRLVDWSNQLELKRKRDGLSITLTEVKDPTVRVLKLLRGEADLIQGDLPPELVKYLQTKPDITLRTTPGINFSYLGLNLRDPLLKSHEVRQAIAHAIDRGAIINKVMVDHTRVAEVILPPEHYINAGMQLPQHAYNPQLAKTLLKQAGVKLPLKLVYKTSTDPQRVRFATIMQSQMRPAGIALEIRSLDWGTFFADVKQGNFQLYGLTWVGIRTPEIYLKAFGSAYDPPLGFNRGHYADPKLDTMLAAEQWQDAEKYIHQQLPVIPLWYEGQFVAYNHHIRDYRPKADGNWDALASLETSVKMDAHAN